ncbi:uncharacterized protein LAJ45_05365 [Morchella importuna]|uniref:uncharacterized protein n=1 Tax=Morchella importuna TaxID=1174673 RepID=UPI001E8DBBC0|nr:uncharacterized protein LAJ45_05365 [Morchella importuna]KAH8150669.1 hypothetical protein LAJ45_05365 [Morchella importuna]
MASGPAPVYVLGVGMTKFIKPRGKVDYPELGFEAGIKAMVDAGINYDDVDQGIACYAYGDSTCGQRVFYQFGMTQIPVYNVNNNCSTGSTDCTWPGNSSPTSFFNDRVSPMDKSYIMMNATRGIEPKKPGAAQLFGNAGREYMEKYGATDVYTHEQIMKSPEIFAPLTKLQCCPTSDGAAAAVLVSHKWLEAHPELKARAILIAGQSMNTDAPSLYSKSAIDLIGYDMTKRAGITALAEAGVSASSIKLVELHDCFSTNELITIDGLGLCPPGKAHEMVRSGDITYGGRVVINPSGGLISKGHPLGATGLAQCAELVWHLRGQAGERNVEGVEAALQHNLGLGGAVVVTVYKRADGGASRRMGVEETREVERVGGRGYNPAVEARG